ncbi:MAG TPA: NPCBM/NEW2 domain-containing protein [Phycisphaerae bacterium]|nr:NPCBM/NEW2 domain-containing protein [Phycisphaerae bacterium]
MIGLCTTLLLVMAADRPAAATQPAAQVLTVEGAQLDIQIDSIQTDVLRYHTPKGSGEIPLSNLERVMLNSTPQEPNARSAGTFCTFYLTDGGVLEGVLLKPEDESGRDLRVDVGLKEPLVLRLDALAGIRFGRPNHGAAEAEFDSRLAQRAAGRDLLVVPQGSKAVVLPGALERLEPDRWTFRFGDKLQVASLDKAFGVVLGGVRPPSKTGSATLNLAGRNRIVGQIRSADHTSIAIDAGPLGQISLPWDAVSTIALRSDRVVYVSELEPSTTTQRSLFDVSWPPRRDTSVTGGPLVLNGRSHSRGLGVHADTILSYKLDGGFDRFLSTIGIDDSAAGGAAVFRVRGDDRVLYKSDVMTARESESIAVDVHGVRELTLECLAGPELDLADHGDWADARLIRASAGPAD